MSRKERRLKGERGQKVDRRFLGEVNYNPDFTPDQNKQNSKLLKSYLKGYEKYTYGFEQVKNPITGLMETKPKWHTVRQEIILL